eukprot:TRINITY_DN14514_c2_g2_i1.p1 TRINITY_DN14514_c2_g2~~TRINITY_DN14514_c2_g2_i1.p1  ORF type:complete len:354 (-),score=29.84 TRINITY_DN14514_c2_g2_i1:165-1226(-)
MNSERHVTIQNTFITILDDSDNESDVFPRQYSDPTAGRGLKVSCAKETSPEKIGQRKDTHRANKGCTPADESVGDRKSTNFKASSQTDLHRIQAPLASVPEARSVGELSTSYSSGSLCSVVGPSEENDTLVDELPIEWRGKTSVMIRNISYQLNQCALSHALHEAGFGGLFDYVYVPMNASGVTSTSKGYAFVNFLSAHAAYSFKTLFDGRSLTIAGNHKRLQVIPSNLQGYNANVSHYKSKLEGCDEASMDLPEQSRNLLSRVVGVEQRDSCQRSRHHEFPAAKQVLQSPEQRETYQARMPQEMQKIESTQGTQPSTKNMTPSFCSDCGTRIQPSFRFCCFCGARLSYVCLE